LPFALAELLGLPAIEQVVGIGWGAGGPVIQVRASGGRRRTCALEERSVLVAARGGPAPYPSVVQKLMARRACISVLAMPEGGGGATALAFQGLGPARPVTRHLLRPSASANAAGRLRQLMAGGASATNDSRTLAGAGLAGQLAELLTKEGFVP
jgi:hypothetical protein